MKKILWLLLLLLPIKVLGISAESAIVMDADSRRVLYCKNCEKEKLIASTTKIMTSVIALEYGNLNKGIEVGDEILKAYGSAIYIQKGELLTLKELLYGLMLRSGNDAAMTIAKGVTGGMESFVYLMNVKAKSLGMNDTFFYNNHGLEESNGKGNTSTAKDMAILMSYAMRNDIFKEITSTKEITIKSNYKTYVWVNKNKLLKLYDYTTGGKTGYTEKAKRTLVTSASKDGKNLVVVTLNDGNDFDDHKDLYEKYFEEYEVLEVLNKNDFVVKDLELKNGNVLIKNNFQILVKENDDVKTEIDLLNKDKYSNGDVIGKAKVLLNDEIVHEEKIYFEENINSKKSFWEKVWDFIKFW